MIDFYRKSFLSQLGKDAGNLNMPDFARKISEGYTKYSEQLKERKNQPHNKANEDYDLYL